ncbi:MAG: UDP-glucose/GDP-mannose dehydrogenase family protein [Betaproteobacteria bacterium]|jgi:UDPglucose 6-dehydrogenase|nr:UDP-glucose/GDP-mannose dehydrogenase family protein [Betaproteobacteria bacterium]
MKITVFGTGYVGLVQGAVLADAGHSVTCVDIDLAKLDKLKEGEIPIFEPGLEALVKSNYAEKRLMFTSDAEQALSQSDVVFIAVGTPPDEDGSADLKHVLKVAETIGQYLQDYTVVVNKSTVPVGTADKVQDAITRTLVNRGSKIEFDVVSNPEFLKEGAAVADCQRPDRIVIGTDSARAEKVLRELYEPFNRNHDKIIVMGVRSSEMTKYAANCMLAAKISFMNEMANIAEAVGADIESVRQGIGSDQRIGYHFIYAGAGYGGSCFPKDVSALVKTAEQMGFDPLLLNAIEARNKAQKRVVFEKLNDHFQHNLKGKTFALWGLSFKPNTDDMREAPSRVLMEALWQSGAKVQAYDPAAMEETQHIYGQQPLLQLCGTKEAALNNADALIIMTEWRQFKAPDFELLKNTLKQPVIFDGRNLFDPARMKEKGFTYKGIGR